MADGCGGKASKLGKFEIMSSSSSAVIDFLEGKIKIVDGFCKLNIKAESDFWSALSQFVLAPIQFSYLSDSESNTCFVCDDCRKRAFIESGSRQQILYFAFWMILTIRWRKSLCLHSVYCYDFLEFGVLSEVKTVHNMNNLIMYSTLSIWCTHSYP